MTKDQRPYCREILDRIRRIEDYTAAGREAFMESELLQDGVIRSFEVIGEVAKRLDRALTERYPQIIWSDYAGFCDVLIHRYQEAQVDLVWDATQEDLSGCRPPMSLYARESSRGKRKCNCQPAHSAETAMPELFPHSGRRLPPHALCLPFRGAP